MARWRRIVLGGRWLLIAASLLVGVTIATIAYQHSAVAGVVARAFEDQIRAEADLLADVVAALPPERRGELADRHPERDRRLTIIAPDGGVVGDSHGSSERMEEHSRRPEVIAARRGGTGFDRRISATTGRDTVYAARALPDGWVVRVGAPSEDRELLIVATWWPMALGAGVVVAITGALALIQIWRDQRRFGELAEVARSFGDGALDRRAGLLGTDALARLGHELNRLGDRLAASRSELRAKQALLDEALGALSEGVACIDPLDRVVYANPAYRRLAAGGDDPLTLPFYQHLPDAGIANAVAAARSGAGAAPVDGLACEHRGRHLVATVVPIDPSVVTLVLYDRTEVRRLEALRRSFVASVSHEFKTPLTSIIGFTDTILDGVLEEDPAAAKQFIGKIATHAARLETLVRDVLTLSRLEQGAWQPCPVDVDLVEIAGEAISAHAEVAGGKQVALALEAPDRCGARLDPEMIRQVLANLLSNAIRYNRSPGRAVIRIRPAVDRVEIDVADTGIGIPLESRPRIFERFYRVDTHRSRATGGTGLGLAIVKHLVEQMRGGIAFTTSDQGTTFTIALPGPDGGGQVPTTTVIRRSPPGGTPRIG